MPHYIVHQRLLEGDDFTIGEFFITGSNISGFFLEPGGPSTMESGKDRRIPPGVYNLMWHNGNKYKNKLKLYNDEVSASRAILIHGGNKGGETEGCLLPGSSADSNSVMHSQRKLQEINKFVRGVGSQSVKLFILEIGDSIYS